MQLNQPNSIVGRNRDDGDGRRPIHNPAVTSQPSHLEPIEIERPPHADRKLSQKRLHAAKSFAAVHRRAPSQRASRVTDGERRWILPSSAGSSHIFENPNREASQFSRVTRRGGGTDMPGLCSSYGDRQPDHFDPPRRVSPTNHGARALGPSLRPSPRNLSNLGSRWPAPRAALRWPRPSHLRGPGQALDGVCRARRP